MQTTDRIATAFETFAQTAQQTPERVAVSTGEVHWTYAELDRWSGEVHRRLEALGAAPRSMIAVFADRSARSLAAMLGVLRAGCVYVPIDPGYPPERVAYMLEDCRAAVVCASPAHRIELAAGPSAGAPTLDPDDCRSATHPPPPPADVPPDALAYVIYTSGSTGAPKGVMVEHRNLVNLVEDHVAAFDVVPEDRVLLMTSLSFDASMFQTFIAWARGASVLLPPEPAIADPEALVAWIDRYGATLLSMPPAYLHTLGRRPMPTVRLVNTGGDAAIPEDALHYARACRYFSTYGPTETTICTAHYEVRPDETFPDGVPLGRPVRNASLFIVDDQGARCPPGQVGEICIAGAGVSRGYLNHPDKTAQKFEIDPATGGRIYRTGDLGYQREDGVFMFRGRKDRQVKIRGFRVEPEEIELRLQSLPGVERAVVVPVGADSRSRRLCAYVVAREPLDPAALRGQLAEQMPAYMLPYRIFVIDEFPRTPNDKIDIARLTAMEAQAPRERIAPETPLEERLLASFERMLGGAPGAFGVTDGFFDIGGDSLSAARLIVHARSELGIELPVQLLLRGAPIRELARAATPASATARESAGPEPLPDAPFYAASHAQHRLWLISQMHGDSVAYNICHAWHIDGALDVAALRAALTRVVLRHESLRTRFAERDGSLVQIVEPEARMGWDEVTGLTPAALAAREAGHALDLHAGPLVRATLLSLADRRALLVLNIHHTVCDGWSMRVFTRELRAAYASLVERAADAPPPLRLQARDIVAWHRRRVDGEEGRAALAYFRERLSADGGPRPLPLATDRPRPARPSYKGRTLVRQAPAELRDALHDLGTATGATLFMVLAAAVHAFLFRETRQTDITVGAPMAERDHPELEDQVGFYVNTVALRCAVSGAETFVQLLERMREVCIGAQAHVLLPFDRVVDAVEATRDPSRSPLFDVMIALQNDDDRDLALPGLQCERFPIASETSKFDLSFDFVQTPAGFDIEVEYATDLFDERRVERLCARLLQLLREVVRRPADALDALELLPSEEVEQVRAFGQGPPLVPDEGSILARYRATLAEHPQRPALICGERVLGYADLAREARGIARRIRRALPDPETGGPIGIMLERSDAFVIAIMAVLELGMAYLPIDPGLPPDRVSYMLADSESKLLISRSAFLSGLRLDEVPVVDLDREPDREAPDADAGASAPGAEHPTAYVIYTSGSTGLPKAVAVSRDNLRHALAMWRQDYGLSPPVVLGLLSFSFDVSVGDLGRSLLSGGTLIVAQDEERVSPSAIVRLATRHRANFVEMTPLIANALTAYLIEQRGSLPPMQFIVVSSDIWRMREMHALRALLHPDTQLLASYGTTETTIDSSFYRTSSAPPLEPGGEDAIVPIGRPMSGVEILILDPATNRVGIGTPGEIYIAGPSVTTGYIKRPELAAAKFLRNPFHPADRPAERMYRTGDVAAWREDGNIAIAGRADHQIKIRGYRVELGEIERALVSHPSVTSAVVVVTGRDRDASLTACVVGPSSDDLPGLESWLASRLPHYMVPQQWLPLDRLPMSTNGKVDREALVRGLSEVSRPARKLVAARNELETQLLDVWRRVLPSASDIGVTDSFFSLGGDSIQVIELVLELRKHGFQLSAAEVFRHPTIASCAAHLQERGHEGEPPLDLRPAEVDAETRQRLSRPGDVELYPATPMQALMVETSLLYRPQDRVYRDLTLWEIQDDPLDLGALRAALERQLLYQTSLRVSFRQDRDGRWYQRILPVEAVEIASHDVSALAPPAQDERVRELTREALGRPFELGEAGEPACRFVLVRRGAGACAVIMVAHHAVEDGWGAMAFESAWLADYEAQKRGQALPPIKPLRTGEQLVALEAARLANPDAHAHWAEYVQRLPAPPYPPAEPREPDAPRFGHSNRALPAELVAHVGAVVKRLGVTLKSMYVAAYLRALAEDAGRPSASAWMVVSGRSGQLDAALESMGLFWHLVPITATLDQDDARRVAGIEADSREAERKGAWFFPALFGNALDRGFPVCFNFTHFRNEQPPRGGVRIVDRIIEDVFHFPLTLTVSHHILDGSVVLRTMYDRWVFTEERALALLSRIIEVLRASELPS